MLLAPAIKETFRFDYEYKFVYENDFIAIELAIFTKRSSPAILEVNRKATMLNLTTSLQTPVKNLIVPKCRTCSQNGTPC